MLTECVNRFPLFVQNLEARAQLLNECSVC